MADGAPISHEARLTKLEREVAELRRIVGAPDAAARSEPESDPPYHCPICGRARHEFHGPDCPKRAAVFALTSTRT